MWRNNTLKPLVFLSNKCCWIDARVTKHCCIYPRLPWLLLGAFWNTECEPIPAISVVRQQWHVCWHQLLGLQAKCILCFFFVEQETALQSAQGTVTAVQSCITQHCKVHLCFAALRPQQCITAPHLQNCFAAVMHNAALQSASVLRSTPCC